MKIRMTCLKTMISILLICSSSISFADLTDDIDEVPKPIKNTDNKKNSDSKKPAEDKKKFENPKTEIKPKAKTEKKGKSKNSKMGIYKEGQDNSKLPVIFESEGLRGTKEKGILELKKNVVIKQGDFKIDANTAKIFFDEKQDEVTEVVANGDVKIYKGSPETGGVVKARGDKIVFNSQKQIVTILGNARLWRGKDLVKGKKIIYDLKSGWVSAEKVEGIVQPGDMSK